MSSLLAELIADPARVEEIPTEAIPTLLAQLAAAQSALAARLLSAIPDNSGERPRSRTASEQAAQLITVADASRQLAFKPAYIYELVRQGRLPAVRQGKYVRIRPADLQRWIQQHQNKPIDMM
jgi:excisionase family DNA binding protein